MSQTAPTHGRLTAHWERVGMSDDGGGAVIWVVDKVESLSHNPSSTGPSHVNISMYCFSLKYICTMKQLSQLFEVHNEV